VEGNGRTEGVAPEICAWTNDSADGEKEEVYG
jgi:hypothetical protein